MTQQDIEIANEEKKLEMAKKFVGLVEKFNGSLMLPDIVHDLFVEYMTDIEHDYNSLGLVMLQNYSLSELNDIREAIKKAKGE